MLHRAAYTCVWDWGCSTVLPASLSPCCRYNFGENAQCPEALISLICSSASDKEVYLSTGGSTTDSWRQAARFVPAAATLSDVNKLNKSEENTSCWLEKQKHRLINNCRIVNAAWGDGWELVWGTVHQSIIMKHLQSYQWPVLLPMSCLHHCGRLIISATWWKLNLPDPASKSAAF